jgi:histidinol-phosphate aminotransferase
MPGKNAGMTANVSALTAARAEIAQTPPAHHGAFDYAELEQLGLSPEAVLDFSVNSNPYGPSPQVRQAVAGAPLDRYPDRESLELRRALATQLGVAFGHIVTGNGTAELLWLISFAFLQQRDRVLVIGPTFGEYARTAALMGARVKTWQAQPEENFAVSPEAIERQLFHSNPKLVFLCNPNNPTGRLVPVEMIAGWARTFPQTLFIVDEAYLAFAAARSALSLGLDNILVLCSMTKEYALAGLRLGYAVSHNPAVITALAQVRPAWNVNGLAQAAGVAALADRTYLHQCLSALGSATKSLRAELASLGLSPVTSAAHFFLAPVGNGADFRRRLLEQGVLVRDCASFGLPAYVRIATRRPEENERLLAAIRGLKAGNVSPGGLEKSPVQGV